MKARTSFTRNSLSGGPCIRGNHGRGRAPGSGPGLMETVLYALAGAAMALGIVFVLFSAAGCAPQRSPAAIAVCPPIPVPAAPAAPRVTLPAPDAAGNYCLSQAQVNELAKGIRDLQVYAAQMDAAVKAYNESAKAQAGTAGR